MRFIETSELSRMCHDDGHMRPVEGLLVGVEAVAEIPGPADRVGELSMKVYPALHNGVKCWLTERWFKVFSGQGTDPWPGEEIISFEEGVKLLLERGAYDHLWP